MRSRLVPVILLGLALFASESSARSCIHLECPSHPAGVSSCKHHVDCKNKAEFSASSTVSCSCINVLPSGCRSVDASTVKDAKGVLSVCEANKGNWLLPSPQVSNEGRHVISVVVDRFFEKGMYKMDGIRLNRLFINARFRPAPDKPCIQQTGVEMFVYTNGLCLLRSRVTMPGIEHKSDDHYYYDDQSPLETSLSRDLFFGAATAEFWLDMSKEKIVKLPGSAANDAAVGFKSLLKSGIVEHRLPPLTHSTAPVTNQYMMLTKP